MFAVLLAAIASGQPLAEESFGGEPRSLEGQAVFRRHNMPSPQPVGTLNATVQDNQLVIVATSAPGELPTGMAVEGHTVVRIEPVNAPHACRVERSIRFETGKSSSAIVDLRDSCDLSPTLYNVIARGTAHIDAQPYVVISSQSLYFRFDGTRIQSATLEEWAAEAKPDIAEPRSPAHSSQGPDLRKEILAKNLPSECKAALLKALATRELDLQDPETVAEIASAIEPCRSQR